MSRTLYTLISAIVTGVVGIAEAVLAYTKPAYYVPIGACLPVVEGAIITCCGFFVEDKDDKKEGK